MQVLSPHGSRILGLLMSQRERISPASRSAAPLWISLPHNPAVHPSLPCWAGVCAAEVKQSLILGNKENTHSSTQIKFQLRSRNKSNPVVQHTSETVAASRGCKTEKTSGDLGMRKAQRGVLVPACGISAMCVQGWDCPLKAAQECSTLATSGRKRQHRASRDEGTSMSTPFPLEK